MVTMRQSTASLVSLGALALGGTYTLVSQKMMSLLQAEASREVIVRKIQVKSGHQQAV